MNRVLLGGLICLMIGLLGLIGDIRHDPADILDKYMSLDKKGARLEASSLEVLKPYRAWTDEPAWGQVVVITEFKVSHDITEWEVIGSQEAKIPVTFQVVGAMHWESATFLLEPRNETIFFRVRAYEKQWKIVEPMILPHVGIKRLQDFVRYALLHEEGAERRDRLQTLLESLKDAMP